MSPRTIPAPSRRTALGIAVLAAPLAWAVHVSIGVALVPHACQQGTGLWLYGLTVLLLAVAVAGAVACRRYLVAATNEPDRLLAQIGWWSALLSISLLVIGGALVVGLDPCPP